MWIKRGNELQGDEQREGDKEGEGLGVGMGNSNFRGDLWKQLNGAKTHSVSNCWNRRTVLLNCLSVISDGFAPQTSENRTV